MDRGAYAVIRGTSAGIATHIGINISITWFFIFAKETNSRHDLP